MTRSITGFLRTRVGAAAPAAVVLAASLHAAAAGAQSPTPSYQPREAFKQTDRNGDGVVDHDEFLVRITEVFFHADADRDGVLSVTEVDAALVHTENLGAADSDKSGTLTLHEFRRARLVDFEKADTNGTGTLSETEVVEAFTPKGR